MVKVPFHDVPEEQLSPSTIDPRTAATFGGEIVDLGEGLSSLGEHLQKVQQATDIRKGLVGFTQDSINIHNQMAKDSDLSTASQRSQDSLQKALEDRASRIKDADAREKFLERATPILDSRMTSINFMIGSKQVQVSKRSLTEYGDLAVNNYTLATRPDQMKQVKDDFVREVDVNVKNGTTPPDVGEMYKRQYLYRMDLAQARNDMYLNPKKTLDQLKLGDKGIYNSLTSLDRDNLIEESENLVKRQDNQQKQQLNNYRANNENYLNTLQAEGKLNAQTVNEFGITGRISPNAYKAWQKNFNSPILHGETDADTYNQAIQYMINPKNSMDDIRNHLLNDYGNKKLSKEDYLSLYEMHLRPFSNGDWKSVKDIYGKEQEQKDALRKHLNFMQSAVSLISKYTGQDKNKTYSMMASWAAKTAKDVTPEDYPRMANDVLKNQRLIDNPELATYPEDGRIIQDEDGNRANASPDGSINEDDKTLQMNPDNENGGSDNSSYGF